MIRVIRVIREFASVRAFEGRLSRNGADFLIDEYQEKRHFFRQLAEYARTAGFGG